MEMDEREKSGRLKYARHLSDMLEERRSYHRKDGQIVKMRDDLISALRVAIMMRREARGVQLGGQLPPRPAPRGGKDGDFDLFTGQPL